MIKKATLTKFLVVVALLMTAILVQSIDLVKADPMPPGSPSVIIESDGSINPSTASINKTGNLYTVTNDLINYSLVIECSNITLDGAGHALQGQGFFEWSDYVLIDPVGLTIEANGVTVKNMNIHGYAEHSIEARGSQIVITKNTVENIWLLGNYNNVTGNICGSICLGNIFEEQAGNHSAYNLVIGNNLSCLSIDSGYNSVYLNNFFTAKYVIPIWFDASFQGNVFDNGSVGNYYSNYEGTDGNGDGIGDTPYVTRVNAAEYYTFNYPLMKPVDIMKVLDPYPPALSVLSPQNSTYYNGNVSLTFTANKPTLWIGYSLDGQANVTINGNCTLTELSNGLHNITVYANDTSDNVGRSETISFNVEKPEPVYFAVVVSAAAVSAVVASVSIVYFKKRKH